MSPFLFSIKQITHATEFLHIIVSQLGRIILFTPSGRAETVCSSVLQGRGPTLCVFVCNSETIQKSAAKLQHSSTYYVRPFGRAVFTFVPRGARTVLGKAV